MEAERIVHETVALVAPDAEARDHSLRELHCDPPDSGLMDYDYEQVIDLSAEQDLDTVVEEAWTYWQELGFQADSIGLGDEQPDVNAKLNGYGGQIVGNREQGSVYIEVRTPCVLGAR